MLRSITYQWAPSRSGTTFSFAFSVRTSNNPSSPSIILLEDVKRPCARNPDINPFARDVPGMEGLAHRAKDLAEATRLSSANAESIDDLIHIQLQKFSDPGGGPKRPGRGRGVPTALVMVVAQAEANAKESAKSPLSLTILGGISSGRHGKDRCRAHRRRRWREIPPLPAFELPRCPNPHRPLRRRA
jgi:hypothetical protein